MSTTLVSDDGRIVSGYIQSEDDKKIVIGKVADGTLATLQQKHVEGRRNAVSLMPPGIAASLDSKTLRDSI